jgi:hypothetical protein
MTLERVQVNLISSACQTEETESLRGTRALPLHFFSLQGASSEIGFSRIATDCRGLLDVVQPCAALLTANKCDRLTVKEQSDVYKVYSSCFRNKC